MTGLSGLDATIQAHPHPPGERSFFCLCSQPHIWGERGMLTVLLPGERHINSGFQLIRCDKCQIWHIRIIGGQDADNIIEENNDAKKRI
jgi:hypothetical protein